MIVISATQGIGELATQPFNIIGLFSFAGAVSLLSSMVGRLALHTDRRVLEEQKAADRWQKLASTGFDGFIEVDANTHISDASESVALFLGVSADEMRGVPFRSIFDEAGWSNVSHFVRLALAGQSVRFDRSFTTATGQTEWALTLVEPRLDDSGKFAGCTIFFLNTTATHQIRAERAQARAALVVAQETERRRLAQLVHDGALQDLAAANLLIGAALFAANDNATEPGSPAENLERIESLLVSGMRKLRADAIGSPVIDLRDIGVLDALEQTISKFESVATAEVTISERGIDQAQAELSRLIFQIAQEALVNALVHSKATEIHIDLRRTRDGFSIAVTDDGIGFDNSRLQEVGHMGLSAMAALAHEAGGWCSLSTRPGRGTAVEAWLPDSETSRLGTAIQMR